MTNVATPKRWILDHWAINGALAVIWAANVVFALTVMPQHVIVRGMVAVASTFLVVVMVRRARKDWQAAAIIRNQRPLGPELEQIP